MTRRTLVGVALLLTALCVAPLALGQVAPQALGQEIEGPENHWAFMMFFPAAGMLMVIAIVAIINYSEYRQNQQKLALVERLVANGHTVPPDLFVRIPKLTPAEERRRDIRRGIALLCWGLAISTVFYLTSGGQPRAAAWGLLLLFPSIGNFVKARLMTRELAADEAKSAAHLR